MDDMHPFLRTAQEAVTEAERIIMKWYSGVITSELKADQTPVTQADQEAETVIRTLLSRAFPDHGFLGEEYGATSSPSGYYWIIDPIDGTKNFIRHIPLFGTLLALMKDDELRLGISNCPALFENMHAIKGGAAFLNGKQVLVSRVRNLEDAYISFGGLNAFSAIEKMSQVEKIIKVSSRTRAIGDAYAYHLVASGKLEAVIEAKISFWDIAAATTIVEAAGGRVTDMYGGPIGKQTTTIVASNGAVHNEILELLS
jgi:histidinol-phosphatase